MTLYHRYFIATPSEEVREMAIAYLAHCGIEGFEETDELLIASGKKDDVDAETIAAFLKEHQLNFTTDVIENKNWNALWESSFEPVVVDDFAAVRAHFHRPIAGVTHDLLITPKMSFGTGHHATTYMMMQLMRDIDFSKKTVFDFGTGTGILAILAEKMGAKQIYAIDIDDWCIENTLENLELNGCTRIKVKQSTEPPPSEKFEVVLANINKNILLAEMENIAGGITNSGIALLSGLLIADEDDIVLHAKNYGLFLYKKLTQKGWIALAFNKT